MALITGNNVIDANFNTNNIQSITHFEGFALDPFGALISIPNHNYTSSGYDSYWFMNSNGLSVLTQCDLTMFAIIVEYTKV